MTPALRIPKRLGRPPSHPWADPFMRFACLPGLKVIDLSFKAKPGTWRGNWRVHIKHKEGTLVGYGFSPIEALASMLLAAGVKK